MEISFWSRSIWSSCFELLSSDTCYSLKLNTEGYDFDMYDLLIEVWKDFEEWGRDDEFLSMLRIKGMLKLFDFCD